MTVVFGIIITAALGFMTAQQRAFNRGVEDLMTLQNLRYAYQALEIDLHALGLNVPDGQPGLVLAEEDVIAFTGDYTSNLVNDVSAVYVDPDAPTGMVQAPRSAVSLPNSSYSWPDTTYLAAGGTPSMAELIIFFFDPDTSTARTDDYILKRQVNGADPEVLARNLLQQGSTPFFRYFRKRINSDRSSQLDSIPDGDLPLFHSIKIHGSSSDTANSAKTDSVRALRVTFRSTNGRSGDAERFAEVSRIIDLPNAGFGVVGTCGDEPILDNDLTLQVLDPSGTPSVRITWAPSVDESSGEQDVIRYVLYRRGVPNSGDWGDPFLSIPSGAGSYTYDDGSVETDSTYQYVHAAQDCTPSLSSFSQVQQVTIN